MDFAPPVGYKEPEYRRPNEEQEMEEDIIDYSNIKIPQAGFKVWYFNCSYIHYKIKFVDTPIIRFSYEAWVLLHIWLYL